VVIDNDPTTWPFRGSAAIRDSLFPAARAAMLAADPSAEYAVRALGAGSVPRELGGDQFVAVMGIPDDPAKSIAFGVYQRTSTGQGIAIQPYDIGGSSTARVRALDEALRTGSITYVAVILSPAAASARIAQHLDTAQTDDCSFVDGVGVCATGDPANESIAVLDDRRNVIADVPITVGSSD
jgi:hypothetical protein